MSDRVAPGSQIRYAPTVMDGDEICVLLGMRVVERRESLGLKQRDLAKRLKWPQPRVSELERGLSWPTVKRLAAIAEALECEPGDLLRSEPPFEKNTEKS